MRIIMQITVVVMALSFSLVFNMLIIPKLLSLVNEVIE